MRTDEISLWRLNLSTYGYPRLKGFVMLVCELWRSGLVPVKRGLLSPVSARSGDGVMVSPICAAAIDTRIP